MPWTLHVNPARRLCTLVFEGTVGGSDVVAATEAISRDPDWRLGFSELWDGLAVTRSTLGSKELRDVAALEAAQGQREAGGRVALVTTSLAVRAGLVALLSLYGTGHRPHRVFTTREEAEAWLEER